MSTQTIFNKNNLPTNNALYQVLTKTSVDLIKELKYEVGHVCNIKMRNLLRLERLHCSKFCYIDEEQDRKIREEIIKRAILKIDEM